MYITIQELADYLGLTEQYLHQQIKLGHIKTVQDGHQLLVNREQFVWYKEQIDLKRKQLSLEEEESLPEDWDAKDED